MAIYLAGKGSHAFAVTVLELYGRLWLGVSAFWAFSDRVI